MKKKKILLFDKMMNYFYFEIKKNLNIAKATLRFKKKLYEKLI